MYDTRNLAYSTDIASELIQGPAHLVGGQLQNQSDHRPQLKQIYPRYNAHTLANVTDDVVQGQVVLEGIRVVLDTDIFVVDVLLLFVVVIVDDKCRRRTLRSKSKRSGDMHLSYEVAKPQEAATSWSVEDLPRLSRLCGARPQCSCCATRAKRTYGWQKWQWLFAVSKATSLRCNMTVSRRRSWSCVEPCHTAVGRTEYGQKC